MVLWAECCLLKISAVDALAPNVTIVRDRDWKDVIGLNEVITVGLQSNMTEKMGTHMGKPK